MNDSISTPVAWAVPESSLSSADASQALLSLGLALQPLAISEPLETSTELAVLHTACFRDLDHLGQTYRQLSKPTLIVVTSGDEENQVLKWDLPLTVDICRSELLRPQLGYRLQRLLKAIPHGPVGAGREAPAERDPAKQVYRRDYLTARLAREFASARKHCRSLSIAWMTLEKLAQIRETQGDAAGDRLVEAFSQIALANIRIIDWLGRYSDDEFCLVMPDTWLDEGRAVADRIRESIASSQVHISEQCILAPRAAISVVELTDDEATCEDLIQKAVEATLLNKILAHSPEASA